MKATIQTFAGKVTLKVHYDPALCNWDEAIAAGLASFRLRQGQAAVLALPLPHTDGTKPKAKNAIDGRAHIFNMKKHVLRSV